MFKHILKQAAERKNLQFTFLNGGAHNGRLHINKCLKNTESHCDSTLFWARDKECTYV